MQVQNKQDRIDIKETLEGAGDKGQRIKKVRKVYESKQCMEGGLQEEPVEYLTDHIISYHIISYHIISYHIISYHYTLIQMKVCFIFNCVYLILYVIMHGVTFRGGCVGVNLI